jgi:hypothetical protein
VQDPELEQLATEFLTAFETVFGSDWTYTLGQLHPYNRPHYIKEGATFIEPNVEDEVNDWGYRALLLEKYRALKSLLAQRGGRTS